MPAAQEVLFRYNGDATTDESVTVTFDRLDQGAELTVQVLPGTGNGPRLRLSGFPKGSSICLLVERRMVRAHHYRTIGQHADLPVPETPHDEALSLSALVILVHTA